MIMFRNHSSHNRMPKPVKGLIIIIMAALFVFLLGNVIMYLWNEILAAKTGIMSLNFWEALGLFALARILFGGFRFDRHHKSWHKGKGSKMREKWMNMTEEERLSFKQNWKTRCGKIISPSLAGQAGGGDSPSASQREE